MKTRYTDWLWALCISAALLLVCSKSSPLYLLNDWMDANIFFTTGKAMFSGRVLPLALTATLLPFKGAIITDGLIGLMNITYGDDLKKEFRDIYNDARERNVIITKI